MSDESAKSRALRIRLEYHKHRGLLHWSRWACAIVAVIGSGSYAAFILAGVFSHRDDPVKSRANWFDSAVLQINTGPLAKVHAHFETACQKCHSEVAFRPIASDAFKLDVQSSLDSLSEKCQSCHAVRSHVERITDPGCLRLDQNCVDCHQDHQGREVDLAAVTSRKCTQCHENLNQACGDSANLAINANIDRFSVESHATKMHTFRALSSDPGRIKFSHAQHMNLGQVKTGRRGGFQLTMMSERWRAKYTAVGDSSLVQLACGDCHKLQTPSGNVAYEHISNATSSTDVELSHYYAPIQFDEHCAACHQFTFTGQTTAMTPLPHAATKEDFGQILASRLVGGKLSGQLGMRKNNALEANESHVEKLVDADLKTAVDRVYNQCSKCHSDDMTEYGDMTEYDDMPGNVASLTPMIPQRWLQRGYFDHGAHEKISKCSFCHVVPAGEESTDNSTVMIKGPESCTPCHRSALSVSGDPEMNSEVRQNLLGNANQPSLASDDCTLCHRYHWSRQPPENWPNATESHTTGTTP